MKKQLKAVLIIGCVFFLLAVLLIIPYTRSVLLISVAYPIHEYVTDDFGNFNDFRADYEIAAAFVLKNIESGEVLPGDRIEFYADGAMRIPPDRQDRVLMETSETERAAFVRLHASQREQMTIYVSETDFRFYVSEAAQTFDELVYTTSGKRPQNEDPRSNMNTFYRARHKAGKWYVLHSKWDASTLW